MSVTAASLALSLGPAVAKALVKTWAGESNLIDGVGEGVVDLIAALTGDAYAARRGARLIEELSDEIAGSVVALFERDGVSLDDGERAAVMIALAATLRKLDLSSRALAGADLRVDAVLASQDRASTESLTVGLSERGSALFARTLRDLIERIVDVSARLPAFQPALYARLLQDGTLLREAVGAVLTRVKAIEAALDKTTTPATEFERQYRQQVARKLDRVELFGSSVDTRPYPLTIAYISLDAELTTPEGSVESVMTGSPRVYVRGEAGSGKTTLLQWVAVRMAAQDVPTLNIAWAGRVPFFLRLRAYSDRPLPPPEEWPRELLPHTVGAMPAGWVHQIIHEGRAVLFVDGIDEWPIERRGEFLGWLADVRATSESLYTVLSARPLADELDDLADHESIRLEPMRIDQVAVFVDRWHAAVSEDVPDESGRRDLELLGASLKEQLSRSATLQRLAESPLLCAMLCAVNRDRRGNIPSDRSHLYEQCCEMLLERRDKERKIVAGAWSVLTYRQKRALVAGIAWWMMRNDKSEADVEEVDVRLSTAMVAFGERAAVAPAIMRGLLVERSGLIRYPVPGRIDFIHKTFLEYLAAVSAVDNGDLGIVAKRAHEDGWRETTVLSASIAGNADRRTLIEKLIGDAERYVVHRPTRALLGLACIEESPFLDADLKIRAEKVVHGLELPGTQSEVQSWAAAGDLAVRRLGEGASAEIGVAVKCISALSRIATPSALQALVPFVARDEPAVTRALLGGWRQFTDSGDEYAQAVLAKISDLSVAGVPVPLRLGVRHLRLRWLSLRGDVTGTELDEVAHPEGIEFIELQLGDVLSESVVRWLADLPNLRHMRIILNGIADMMSPFEFGRESVERLLRLRDSVGVSVRTSRDRFRVDIPRLALSNAGPSMVFQGMRGGIYGEGAQTSLREAAERPSGQTVIFGRDKLD